MLCLMALTFALTAPARAEPLLADLSESEVKITTGFTGAKVLLFGSIEGDGQIVIIVRGPNQTVSVRHKEQVAGLIYVNRRSVEFKDAPSYYHVMASMPLGDWLPQHTRELFQIGVEYLKLPTIDRVGPVVAADFREALIRNMQRIGRYGDVPGQVQFMGGQLFRADLYLPANVLTGFYNIDVLLVRDGDVKAIQSTPLLIDKAGLGAQVYNLAYGYPALYGIAAIIIAILAGLAANAVFRKI
jgi:uncharacterized protein (TIGR02186 family)